MELIDRFKYLMKLNQLSASAFADEIGVQRSSVSHILSGRNKPSLEFIQKVIKRFPKVDSSWLISGVTSQSQEQVQAVHVKHEDKVMAKQNTEPSKNVQSEESVGLVSKNQDLKQVKQVKRVLLFYTDGTFEEFANS